jgi:hypothetical protein
MAVAADALLGLFMIDNQTWTSGSCMFGSIIPVRIQIVHIQVTINIFLNIFSTCFALLILMLVLVEPIYAIKEAL